VFGRVIEGMEVVDRISVSPTGPAGPFKGDAPLQPVVIQKIELLAAPADSATPAPTTPATTPPPTTPAPTTPTDAGSTPSTGDSRPQPSDPSTSPPPGAPPPK